jgi:DNA-binding transcriptional ArsR family regulator
MDDAVSRIAAAIGEPARARMLFCLMDNHARTATELSVVAGVTPSTASVHLSRLRTERLIALEVQGKHRYYRLQSAGVARVLESLSVLAGVKRSKFVPNTPTRLRHARTCYDHMAGTFGVSLHDQLLSVGWLTKNYELSPQGVKGLADLGADVATAQAQRRRFAYPCLDWSERRFHLGGALGSLLLKLALHRKWVIQDLDSRALSITTLGRREISHKLT